MTRITKPKPGLKAMNRSAAKAAVSKAFEARSTADHMHAVANIFHDNASHFAKGKAFIVKEARDKLNKALEEEKMAQKDLKKKKVALDKAYIKLSQADLEYKAAVSEELSWVVREQQMKNK